MSNILHNTWAVTRVLLARLRFLAVFLIAALVVGYWEDIRNHIDKWTRPPLSAEALAQAQSDIEYYCVMHPNVIRSEPGDCPICGMPLAKRKKGEVMELPAGVTSRVQLTPNRIALAGIETSPVSFQALTREIRAVGVLDYNETKIAQLSARVAGRADELFVKYVGQPVKKGDAIYSLYSPEVFTAQREYLDARARVKALEKSPSSEARQDAVDVYNASMQKLVLWGLTPEQLDKLDHEYDTTGKAPTHFTVESPISGVVVKKNIYEGGYVSPGDSPLTVADLSTLWLQARVFENDAPQIKVGQRVSVQVQSLENEEFTGTVTFINYQLDPATRTLAARVEVENKSGKLRPGMFAEARFELPVVAEEKPATQQSKQVDHSEHAKVFAAALEPYVKAHDLLFKDQHQPVADLLAQVVAKLAPLTGEDELAAHIKTLDASAKTAAGQDLTQTRKTFQAFSAEMIALGKITGVPVDGAAVRVFRCPMGPKPYWLQFGSDTQNPYYGTEMPDCGAVVESLPRSAPPIKQDETKPTPGKVLAIPRSAVIFTGRDAVVFVVNAEMAGVYDLKPIKVGAPAENFYPVLDGLKDGDQVVTRGAFLLDAENRLNPVATKSASGDAPAAAAKHQH